MCMVILAGLFGLYYCGLLSLMLAVGSINIDYYKDTFEAASKSSDRLAGLYDLGRDW